MNQATKDFVRGMGQALDMGGAISSIRQVPSICRSDAAALRSDWSKIGGDFNRALIRGAPRQKAIRTNTK